jgi:diguanylate cyclase (GGDEF)-like protein
MYRAPPLWRDPVLAVIGLGAVVVLGGLALDLGSARQQVLLCWLLMPVLDLVLLVLATRTARLPGLTRPARRFWRITALAGLLFALGDGCQLVLTLADPATDRLTPGVSQNVTALVGAGLLIATGITYPTGTRTGLARLRVLLDAGILNSCAVLISWCLLTRPGLAEADPGGFATAAGGCGLMVVGTFIAVRIGLAGTGPMVASAAFPLVCSAAIQGLANAIIPSSSLGDWPALQVILLLAPCFAIVCSPRVQELRAGDRRPGQTAAARRRYSLLPYAATLVNAVVLVIVLAVGGLGLQGWGALAGLLLTVTLVIARQVLALTENARLLDRLDESLTEAHELQEKLRHQAEHDVLTGLANRRRLESRMLAAGGVEAAVLLIDLDGFKKINDTYGHACGDAVLVHVAERLRECLRDGDLPARLGGDEFAVLLGAGESTTAYRIAERFRRALAVPAVIGGRIIEVRASVGVAVGPADDPERLWHAADRRMYAEKARR